MKNEQLNQKRQIALFFARFKGELFEILNRNRMETPKKTPAQIRHEQQTAKRKLTERPPMRTKPSPSKPFKKY